MKTLELRKSVVYGPLQSRRFGRSLGINLLPTECKVCNFSCIYCQHEDSFSQAAQFPSLDELALILDSSLRHAQITGLGPDWIMLSGNGEPTLYPDFLKAVEITLEARDHYLPSTRVGVLSNSSTCHRPEIRHALALLDGRFMKLDAGNLYEFHDVNRPISTLIWGDVINGLCRLPAVTIQSLFVQGPIDNTTPRAVDDWIEAIRCISPIEVQIYTLDRAPQVPSTLAASEETLNAIARRVSDETNIPATVYLSD